MTRAAGAAGQVEATPNNFDGIRLLAALAVLVSHQFAVSGLPEPVFGSFISLGSSGVVVFFVISGYLVTRSWLNDPSLLRFAARRLLRIWPGLAAMPLRVRPSVAATATGTPCASSASGVGRVNQ